MAKPSILFVSDAAGDKPYCEPSLRYRCINMAQELVRRGFRSHIVAQDELATRASQLGAFDRYVFHRPRLTRELADFLLRLSPDRAVVDVDDLVFDVKHAEVMPAVQTRSLSPGEARRYVASVAEALRMVPRATVSTATLAQHAGELEGLTVSVVHNHVNPASLGLARQLRHTHAYEARPFAYGYFCGSATHDRDFALIADTLAECLELNRSERLLIVGPVAIPERLRRYAARVRCLALRPFHALPFLMAQCKKVLNPLEITPFTQCKSGAAFFEPALVGCDVISTSIPDLERFSSPLLRQCTELDQWRAALTGRRAVSAGDAERHASALESSVRIEAAFPGWASAVGLEAV